MNDKSVKRILNIIIPVQFIVFAILVSYFLDFKYRENFKNIVSDYKEITINNIDMEKNMDVGDYIGEFLDEKKGLLLREVDSPDYAGDKMIHGYWMSGDFDANKDKLNIEFLGKQYASDESFNKLDDGGSIGLLSGEYGLIEPTPKFIFGDSYVFVNLVGTGKFSGFNGSYKAIGLSDQDVDEFYKGVSKASGISVAELTDVKGGGSAMTGDLPLGFIAIYIVSTILIIGLLSTYTVSKLKNMGTYLLLGWTKGDFIKSTYGTFNKTALVVTLLFPLFGLILSKASFLTPKFIGIYFLAGFINFVIYLIFEFLISLILRTVKPINAIHGRVTKKGLLIFGIILYLLVNLSTGLVSFVGMDDSIVEIRDQYKTKKEWEEVSDYYVTNTYFKGDDYMDPQTADQPTLDRDFMEFYRSIEGKDGVKLINTQFYRPDLREEWIAKDVYKYPPDFSYMEFKADKNYIEDDLDIDLNEDLIRLAKEGYKVYLIPKSFTDEEKKQIEKFYDESNDKDFSDEYVNEKYYSTFYKGNKFITYDNNKEYFTFPNNYDDFMYKEAFPLKTSEPVISLITSENMSYFESRSLLAGGETNSYIKLNQEAYDKYINKEYYKKFNLDDNMPEFVKIADLITGMIRSLTQHIATFIILALFLTYIGIMILSALIKLYREIYGEEVNIKKFLGYDNKKIYKALWIIVILASLVNIIISLVKGSISGISLSVILFIIQYLMLDRLTKRNQFENLVEFLK